MRRTTPRAADRSATANHHFVACPIPFLPDTLMGRLTLPDFERPNHPARVVGMQCNAVFRIGVRQPGVQRSGRSALGFESGADRLVAAGAEPDRAALLSDAAASLQRRSAAAAFDVARAPLRLAHPQAAFDDSHGRARRSGDGIRSRSSRLGFAVPCPCRDRRSSNPSR